MVDSQGAWSASLGMPQQHASELIVADLRVDKLRSRQNAGA
jgi:hypothetical protein